MREATLGDRRPWTAAHRLTSVALIVLICGSVDVGSKLWARAELAEWRSGARVVEEDDRARGVRVVPGYVQVETSRVIPGAFDLVYAENRAAAFGFTQGLPESLRRPLLVAVTLLLLGAMAAWVARLRERDALLLVSLGFVMGGAAGNLYSRVAHGYVIDWLDVYVAHRVVGSWLVESFGTNHWPTFNLADVWIVVGAGGVLLRSFRPLR